MLIDGNGERNDRILSKNFNINNINRAYVERKGWLKRKQISLGNRLCFFYISFCFSPQCQTVFLFVCLFVLVTINIFAKLILMERIREIRKIQNLSRCGHFAYWGYFHYFG